MHHSQFFTSNINNLGISLSVSTGTCGLHFGIHPPCEGHWVCLRSIYIWCATDQCAGLL